MEGFGELIGAAMGTLVLLAVLLAIAGAIATSCCAAVNGRSPFWWFVLALLFTPPMAVLMLVAVGKPRA